MNEWIDVNDRLPETRPDWEGRSVPVLIATRPRYISGELYRDVAMGRFHDWEGVQLWTDPEDCWRQDVTHWMPLPELPPLKIEDVEAILNGDYKPYALPPAADPQPVAA